MEIRNAQRKDLDRIMEIYAAARAFMAAHGNPKQWGSRNWPPRDLIVTDIETQKCYVCVNENQIVGVFYYDFGFQAEPCYNEIRDGQWIGEQTYGVVHRIASDGSVKGIGSCCISWAYGQCRHLRIDTHPDNTVMQSFLEKHGFVRCGYVSVVEDDDPRIAYERIEVNGIG